MPIVFKKKIKKLVEETRCSKCGKVPPEGSMAQKCPYCGGPLVVVTKVREFAVPHVLALDKSKPPDLKVERQADLVKDFGFPDVLKEIESAKKKGEKKE